MKFELNFSVRHLWLGIYWEEWKEPYRLDVWLALPFIALHIIKEN